MENQNGNPVSHLTDTTLKNLRALVDTNAIIGQSINLPDGTTIIPVSRISFGYGTGGSDIPTQKPGEHFGGGGGGGVSIEPIAFLVITSDGVQLLQVATATNSADRIVNMVPQMFDKVSGFVQTSRAKKAGSQTAKTAPESTGSDTPE